MSVTKQQSNGRKESFVALLLLTATLTPSLCFGAELWDPQIFSGIDYKDFVTTIPYERSGSGFVIDVGENDLKFNPSTDDNSDMAGTVRYTDYPTQRMTGWSGNATRWIKYNFEPGRWQVPELRPGKYYLQFHYWNIRDSKLLVSSQVNGQTVSEPRLTGGVNRPVRTEITTEPFEYTGGPLKIKITAEQIEQGDRLRLVYIKIKPYEPIDLSDTVTLENDTVAVDFTKEGSLVRIFNKQTRTTYTSSSPIAHQPIKLQYLIQQTRTYQRLGAFKCTGYELIDGKRITFGYEFGDKDILVSASAELLDNNEIHWSVEVTNNSFQRVVGVEYPRIGNLKINDNAENDVLIWPFSSGQKRVGQATTYMQPYFSRLPYPGKAGLPLTAIYDDSESLLYLNVRSKDPHTVMFKYLTGADDTCMLVLEKLKVIPHNTTWKWDGIFLGIEKGDWHLASDRYRDWADANLKECFVPEWMPLSDGLCQAYMYFKDHRYPFRTATNEYEIVRRFEDIPKMFDKSIEDYGLSDLWGCSQMSGGMCCYRYYYPDPGLGNEETLARANKEVLERGGHVFYYTNGMNWDGFFPESLQYILKGDAALVNIDVPFIEDWKAFTERNSMRAVNGSWYMQYDGPGEWNFRIMNANRPEWQQYMLYWGVEKYAREYNATGMQLDQIGLVYWGEDFSDDLRYYGLYGHGLAELLRLVNQEGRRVNPDFGTFTEGAGDIFGQYSPFQGFHIHSPYYFPEFYRYTRPQDIMMLNHAWGGRDNRGLDMSELLFLTAIRDSNRIPEPFRELRRRIKSFLYRATFRNEVGLGGMPEGVDAKLFEFDKENAFIIPLVDTRILAERIASVDGLYDIHSVMEYKMDPEMKDKDGFVITVDQSLYPALDKIKYAYWYSDHQGFRKQAFKIDRKDDSVMLEIPSGPSFASAVILMPDVLSDLEVTHDENIRFGQKVTFTVLIDGNPVRGAKVKIGNNTLTTNRRGRVEFTFDAYDGYYTISAEKQGHLSYVGFIQVHK